ncbi:hypothetical protein PybrP1_004523 [[Pythium] brassicae (nom. inval.)]|nr:hypothetical protein PybrP1_004523 [[Pythium] brassicae (nom. inval.)]
MIAKTVVLAYPDFTQRIDVHTDASRYKLGGVSSQGGKPTPFWSQKCTYAQYNYPANKLELLSIDEIVIFFPRILPEPDVRQLRKRANAALASPDRRVGAKLQYIKGENSVVADALSRLTFNEKRRVQPWRVQAINTPHSTSQRSSNISRKKLRCLSYTRHKRKQWCASAREPAQQTSDRASSLAD